MVEGKGVTGEKWDGWNGQKGDTVVRQEGGYILITVFPSTVEFLA